MGHCDSGRQQPVECGLLSADYLSGLVPGTG